MYCKHCGSQIEDNSVFCSYCGGKTSGEDNRTLFNPSQNVEQPNKQTQKPENPAQTTAIIGLVLAFFCSIAGLIVSAIALKKYSTQENQEGKGMAIAGLILSIISVVVSVLSFLAICTNILVGI